MIKRIAFVFLISISTLTFAQRNNSSPYSFFGVGQEFSGVTVEQASMGNLGAAFSDVYHLNFTNPAAYSSLRFATYSLGAVANRLTVDDGATKQSSTATSLSYVALGIPLGDKAGFGFGIQPITSVGYSLVSLRKDNSGNTVERTRFYGQGGLNRIYASLGLKVYKGLSLGIEADFTFGNIENNILNTRANVHLSTKNNEKVSVRENSIVLGAQYKGKVGKDLSLHLGATTKLENKYRLKGTEYLYTLTVGSVGNEIPRDTLSTTSVTGTLANPLKTTFGAGLGKDSKWYGGFEYETQGTQQAVGTILANTKYRYGSSSRFSVGGFYIPKINSISSYWERVTYRAGVRFENTGLLIDGTGTGNNFTPIRDFGISFGVGLPVGRIKLSNLNLGIEYGQRGTNVNNLIKESYFNFRLSLSLNDTWFIKRRID